MCVNTTAYIKLPHDSFDAMISILIYTYSHASMDVSITEDKTITCFQ